ncbi:hypothetical protein KFK09_004628 [Dendrobium nobile]|uniref:Uncharacterized protein n=1 Tax=Dendrobium nobile TaxID=94219 RepID=A0A8T3C600_DENNO|nr:hypothetical protein KFK09_004628 [Dendrobium nobile]
MSGGFYFMKRKQFLSLEVSWPTIEVYVTGLFSGSAIMMKYEGFASENDVDIKSDYIEVYDGELSLFNVGVGVGLGIGLTICLCIGGGTGLLLRTYKTIARNCKGLL